ncbi:MAG: trypsin-like peptidase domain-containing protein [Chloroflexota bacterium]
MANVLESLSNEMAGLVESVGASIVRVEARKRQPASGIVWSDNGVIVTTNHVVQRDENITIGLPDGETTTATLVGRDPTTDIAVLQAESSGLTAATWVESSDVAVGNLVLALGRPGLTVQSTLGVISGLGTKWRTAAGGEMERYFQTDVTMYPGFSGGPLATAGGQMAGINSSALMRGVSLTIPTGTVRGVTQALMAYGHMPRGYMGVGIQPVRLPDAIQEELGQETGLMLMSIESEGPAEKAEMLQGDILVKLGDDAIRYADELQLCLTGDRVGQEVEALVVRSGQLKKMTVTIGAKQAPAEE